MLTKEKQIMLYELGGLARGLMGISDFAWLVNYDHFTIEELEEKLMITIDEINNLYECILNTK